MDRRLIENFDWSIIWALLAIMCIGLLSIYSALYPQIQARPTNNLFIKQLIWLAIGFAVMGGSLFFNYQRLRTLSPWLYGFFLLLLVVVLAAGKEVHGSRRWLEIGGFQPCGPGNRMRGRSANRLPVEKPENLVLPDWSSDVAAELVKEVVVSERLQRLASPGP
jgi:hypothetical protein